MVAIALMDPSSGIICQNKQLKIYSEHTKQKGSEDMSSLSPTFELKIK